MPETDEELEQTAVPEPRPGLPAAVKSADPPKTGSKAFRTKLLSRLPKLEAAKWEAGDTLDVYKDFRGVVDLDADAFLRPLEPLAEERQD